MKILSIGYSSLISIVFITVLFHSVDQSKAIEPEETQSIGYYTAGCIKNSAALPVDGTGYQVIRLSRQRFYGHPDLIEYIQSLAEEVTSRLRGELLIGDLSQKNGGPLPDDHSSHQIGLDADILFWQNPIAIKRTLSPTEREKIEPLSLMTPDFTGIDDSRWNPIYGGMLKLAATSNKVDRIFVNPFIKRKLCETYKNEDWLRKIRPWWGHDGHFHVRLHCPDSSPLCKPQPPVPPGDGCDSDLDGWFKLGSLREKKSDRPKARRPLPKECLTLLSNQR